MLCVSDPARQCGSRAGSDCFGDGAAQPVGNRRVGNRLDRRSGDRRGRAKTLQGRLSLRSLVVPLERCWRSGDRRGPPRTRQGLCLSCKALSPVRNAPARRPRQCRLTPASSSTTASIAALCFVRLLAIVACSAPTQTFRVRPFRRRGPQAQLRAAALSNSAPHPTVRGANVSFGWKVDIRRSVGWLGKFGAAPRTISDGDDAATRIVKDD
jgi:hypothetical protein